MDSTSKIDFIKNTSRLNKEMDKLQKEVERKRLFDVTKQ